MINERLPFPFHTPTELMDSSANGVPKLDDDRARHARRVKLKQLNLTPVLQGRS